MFFCPGYKGRCRVHLSLLSPLPEYHAAPDRTRIVPYGGQHGKEDIFPLSGPVPPAKFLLLFLLSVHSKNEILLYHSFLSQPGTPVLHYPVFSTVCTRFSCYSPSSCQASSIHYPGLCSFLPFPVRLLFFVTLPELP